MQPIIGVLVSALTLQPDTVVRLGAIERDLTGDGRPEIMQLIGTGRSIDSLEVTFSIESAGRVVFQMQLRPLSRNMGFDNGRTSLSSAEWRARLTDFSAWFFDPEKFMRASQLVAWLQGSGPRHVARIPEVIARDGGFGTDVSRAEVVWQEIQKSAVTIFQFSSGGDAITAIGWSTRDQRFYRLLECC